MVQRHDEQQQQRHEEEKEEEEGKGVGMSMSGVEGWRLEGVCRRLRFGGL